MQEKNEYKKLRRLVSYASLFFPPRLLAPRYMTTNNFLGTTSKSKHVSIFQPLDLFVPFPCKFTSWDESAATASAVVTPRFPIFMPLVPYRYIHPGSQLPSSHCKFSNTRRSSSHAIPICLHVDIRIAKSSALPLRPSRSCTRDFSSGPSVVWRWASLDDRSRRPMNHRQQSGEG